MCKCTPEMRTPFCGKPGCEWRKSIKLEVGKKYNIVGHFFPCTYLGCKYNFCDLESGYSEPYIFLSTKGTIITLSLDAVKLITEHREMIKNSVEGWIIVDNDKPLPDEALDIITARSSYGNIYAIKKEAEKDAEEIANDGYVLYGRFTFEQLPEPEEN